MVTLTGYDDIIKKVYDNNQEHVFAFWDDLSDDEKKSLCDELASVDFELLKKLYSGKEGEESLDFEPAPFIPVPETDEEKKQYDDARQKGIDYIKSGKVAAFVVAGGQGSRLGYDGPKGKFPVGPVSGKTLFRIHGEKIKKYSEKYGVSIPWLIMTSRGNHDETVQYMESENYMGLNKEDVIIFPQNMIPSLDDKGYIMLQTKSSLFKNPDGHGGSLTALMTSGALDTLKKRGIETISYFQVDNPLVKIVDPVFIGFHLLNKADISSKALKKAYAQEKIGVFVKFSNDRIGVVEYSDLPDEKAEATGPDGDLLYSAGSIAIHMFERRFVENITSGKDISLPFHTAKKKIKALRKEGEVEVDGYKFEKFVFDALPLTEKNVVFETIREEEFAPVKNPSGVDSVESAQELMINQHKSWLTEKGVSIPAGVKRLEISPLYAVEAEDVAGDISLPDEEDLLID